MLFYKRNKEELPAEYVYFSKQGEQLFIKDLKEDLETLKGESFQRHEPEYYDERWYYNEFHNKMPESLLLSRCYAVFVKEYIKNGKSLYESVDAFIKKYESENNNEHQ